VRFGPVELERMCAALGMKPRQFLKSFAAPLDARQWILRDRLVPGPHGFLGREKWCIFLDRHPDGRHGCRLGDAKPRQCHAFSLRLDQSRFPPDLRRTAIIVCGMKRENPNDEL